MIKLLKINKDNINIAIDIENEIFPLYDARNNYYDSLKDDSLISFFIICNDNTYIGVSGIYAYQNDKDNAWIGFFGIKEEYRGNHYGKDALILSEEYAKEKGYKFIRLFTDKYDNDYAIEFYKRNGYVFEDYKSDEELLMDEFEVVIGSKSISKYKVDKWDNRFINLSKQTIKQKYNED